MTGLKIQETVGEKEIVNHVPKYVFTPRAFVHLCYFHVLVVASYEWALPVPCPFGLSISRIPFAVLPYATRSWFCGWIRN